MIQNNKILCIIPARAGSKGLPGKNIKMLHGLPLIAYTIHHAYDSKYIDRCIVSTEDKTIADVALQYGAEIPFMRPNELATDNSSTIDVLLHAIQWMEDHGNRFQIIILLHVTTPLRNAEDIDQCIELLINNNADSIFSVTSAHRNPYFNMVEVEQNKVKLVKPGNFKTRQSAPKVFDMNASIYVWWTDRLKLGKSVFLDKSMIYEMPKDRSIDIDDNIDFFIADMLLSRRNVCKGV